MHIPELSDVQTEKATCKALSTHKRKAQGSFQCASEVKTDIIMARREKTKMKELK